MIFESKLVIPKPVFRSVKRSRLLAKAKSMGCSLLLVVGSAGVGKTEFARQYSESFDGGVLWYTLSPDDGDLRVFVSHLSALLGLRPSDCETPPDFDSVVMHITALAAESEKKSDKGFLLVFDGFEQLRNDEIHQKLKRLLSILPRTTQMLITTRGRPSDVFSRNVISGSAAIIGNQELFFDKKELTELGKLYFPDFTAKMLNQFRGLFGDILDGMPAVESLALSYYSDKTIPEENIDLPFFLRDSMLGGYLHNEFLSEFRQSEQDIIINMATLAEIDVTVCESIFGTAIREIVPKLGDQAVLHRSDRGLAFSPLFHHFLDTLDSFVRRDDVGRIASEQYLKRQNYILAAKQAAKSGDSYIAVKILDMVGASLLEDEISDSDMILKLCVTCFEQSTEAVPHLSVDVLGIAAQYHYKMGDGKKAESYLNQADIGFGKENKFSMYRALYRGLGNYKHDKIKYGKMVVSALFLLSENGFALPYIKERDTTLIEKIKSTGEHKPRRLVARFFGQFKVTLPDGKLMPWRTRKSIELFAYLIFLDGEAISRRKLLDTLWNDEMPDNAVSMLHNIIYNIRKELAGYNMNDIIRYKDKMYSIDMEQVESDLHEMKALCDIVESAETSELLARSDKFRSYPGQYLEDLDNNWILELREYYDAAYLKVFLILAEDYAAREEHAMAVVFLKNILAINPYDEDVEQKILESYGASRNLKLVKTEYERFKNLLEKDLGVAPGTKLENAYKRILGR